MPARAGAGGRRSSCRQCFTVVGAAIAAVAMMACLAANLLVLLADGSGVDTQRRLINFRQLSSDAAWDCPSSSSGLSDKNQRMQLASSRRMGDEQDDDDDAACRLFLQRFHALNECFRSWQSPCPQSAADSQMTRAEPLYFFADMRGQGVGRLIDHAAETAMLAYALHRPFMMDLAWDPHGTLRFLINGGSYQWYYEEDGSTRHQNWLDLHRKNITLAINAMQDKGHNGWANWTDLPRLDDILPMSLQRMESMSGIDAKELFDPEVRRPYTEFALDVWQRTRDHQIAISPNWGDAWFLKIELNSSLHFDGCPKDRTETLIQNAIWAPTPALKRLFASRREKVLGKSAAQQTYGAIHFRTHFLRTELLKPKDKDNDELLIESMADVLADCVTRLSDVATTWWVLSDKDELARAMLAKVEERRKQQKITNNQTLDQFSFVFDSIAGGTHTRVGKYNCAGQKLIGIDRCGEIFCSRPNDLFSLF